MGPSHQDRGVHVCHFSESARSPQGRCQHFDEYFSISRLPLSALAFVLWANPSEREEILARHLPQVITEVPATQRPLHTAIHSAEEAVFRPRKQESAIKSYTRHNKSNVGDAERRKDGSPPGQAGATVTQAALLGTALSTDRSHEILHIATYSMLVTAIMIDGPR